MRNLSLYGAAAVVLIACNNDVSITTVDAELTVSPSLTDVGTVPVGEVVTSIVQIDHSSGGDVKIKNITVTNIEGDFFSYAGDTSFDLEREGIIELELIYTPTEIGYHRATIEVVHNAQGDRVEVDIRGHAVLPEATVWPLGLDFGPVDVGSSSKRSITVANQSDLDLIVDNAAISNGVFTVTSAVPFTVNGGNELVVDLEFVPTDDQPAQGSLTLEAGQVPLPQVALRGNDCENGDPDAYDQDGDGYTLCGGDCDDLNADVHPGGDESNNAGVDDNCDGEIDEDTVWADDDGDGYCEDENYCSDGSMTGDCSDSSDPTANTDQVYPGAPEDYTNGIDDDCDGVVDQGTTDADGDGYSEDGGDCNDDGADLDGDGIADGWWQHPGAPELPDFLDNDCDSIVDETTVLYDDDGDGYCDDPTQCSDGSMPDDCDDDASDNDGNLIPDGRPTSPGAPELYDWRDNDCDGIVDEGTIGYDDDGDGYTEVGGDCNDDPADNDGDGIPDGAAFSPALGNCP